MNQYIFRAYDIRGEYPKDIDEKTAYKIARAYAERFPDLKKIVVQTDIKKQSRNLKDGLIKGLNEGGKTTIDIGAGPIPLMYFSVCFYPYDGGITITASHLPGVYTGLKMQTRNAYPVITEDLEKIKEIVMKMPAISLDLGDTPRGLSSGQQNKVKTLNPEKDYIDYVSKKISLKKPLKIIIDTGNGACGYLPEKIFKNMGCKVKTLFADYDDRFPNHIPDPYEEKNLEALKQEVIKEKADIGFGFDGDGDRVGVVDNKGRTVIGDLYLLMLAKDALKIKRGPVVHEVRISTAFLEEMKKEGVKTYFTVGHHKAVLDKIKNVGAAFGGETTGHIYFPNEYYLYDDAIFSALKIAKIASEKDDFAAYVDTLPRYFTSEEIFIPSPDEIKFNLIKKLQNYLRKNNYDFIDIDGARINFKNGWALVRAANTSPFIKCRFEGKTKKDLAEIIKESAKIFQKNGIKLTSKLLRAFA